MYNVQESLPVERLRRGFSILGAGQPMVGKQDFGRQFLSEGLENGETVVVVSTDSTVQSLRQHVEAAVSNDQLLSERLLIVDATQVIDDCPSFGRIESVSSPGNLTGIGVATSEFFAASETERIRLLVDSVSTLAVYNEFDRLYRFLHVLNTRLQKVGGLGCFLTHADAIDGELDTVLGLFDGLVEFRKDGVEQSRDLRYRDEDGGTTEWFPLTDFVQPSVDSRVRTHDGERGFDERSSIGSLPSSLHAFIDQHSEARFSLTLLNTDTGTISDLESLFQRVSVPVKAIEHRSGLPTDVAILHDDSELISTAPVETLRHAARLVEDGESLDDIERPRMLEQVTRGGYRINDDGRGFLPRVSRMIEARAGRVGYGNLHVGFQHLSRSYTNDATRRMYERLAQTDLDLHLYGARGTVDFDGENTTIYTEPGSELADTWFLAYDGGNAENRKICMVAEERTSGRYYGFWSREPGHTDQLVSYLHDRYHAYDPLSRRDSADQQVTTR